MASPGDHGHPEPPEGIVIGRAPCGCDIVLPMDLVVEVQDPPELEPSPVQDQFEAEVAKLEENHRRAILADIEQGASLRDQVVRQFELSTNEEMKARLADIGTELARIANERHVTVTWGDSRFNPLPYRFYLLRGSEINAFSMAGGFIYVFEGLFEFAESDHEVAGVLAHEIAHASFRHVDTLIRESQRTQIFTVPAIIAAIFLGGRDAGVGVFGVQALEQALQSGWRVEAEVAADYGAIQYLEDTDFDPTGLLTFMERLAYRDQFRPNWNIGIFQTHPPTPERANFITRTMRDREMPIRRSRAASSFAVKTRLGSEQNIELVFEDLVIHSFAGENAIERAETAATQVNIFLDRVPEPFQLGRGPNRRIDGDRRVLFEVTREDALSRDMSHDQAYNAAFEAMQRVSAGISSRVRAVASFRQRGPSPNR